MNLLARSNPAFLSADFTVWMFLYICIPYPMPVVSISLLLFRSPPISVVEAVCKSLMLLAVSFMSESWTSWMGARMLWFVWHLAFLIRGMWSGISFKGMGIQRRLYGMTVLFIPTTCNKEGPGVRLSLRYTFLILV